MNTRTTHAIAAIFSIAMLTASAARAQEAADTTQAGMVSLLDVAPATYYGMLRYPKFYGDPNMDRMTVDGPIYGRQYLSGSWGGARDTLANAGWVVDASVTQVYQGAVSGDGDSGHYVGSADLWGVLDTGRAGLWSGGLVYSHFEGDWGETVSGTGALLPLNGDAIMPAAPSSLALSELYLVQALPDDMALVAGKVDFAAFADTSFFANSERSQFLYEGLINNPILGSFVPYTTMGAMLLKQFSPELGLGLLVASNNMNALSPGFDDLTHDTLTYGAALSWTPKFNGLPGSYSVLAGYTSKNTISFDLDRRYLIGEIIGTVPVAEKNDNYAATLTGTQYLWVDESAKRSDGQPVGFGPFFRAGFAPDDRNLIDQFYSFGIGGNGGILGRVDDSWGIGWAGTHFSDQFRDDAAFLGFDVDKFEHAAEAFYNFAITPAVHTSFHAQYINSANPANDNSLVLAVRLQTDF